MKGSSSCSPCRAKRPFMSPMHCSIPGFVSSRLGMSKARPSWLMSMDGSPAKPEYVSRRSGRARRILTGVADANMDHAPLIALTGQSSLDRMHKESHQYIDVMAMFKPVTKWQAQIAVPAIIPEAFRKAFKVAQTEKPGATHLELPENVAAGLTDPAEGDRPLLVQAPLMPEPLHAQVQRAIQIIQVARRPLILAGNGVVRRRAHEAIRQFARSLNIPVVHTFMGKGIIPDSDPLSLYTIGFHWRDYSHLAMEEADVVIAVGYDFVEYAPCFWNPNRDKHI